MRRGLFRAGVCGASSGMDDTQSAISRDWVGAREGIPAKRGCEKGFSHQPHMSVLTAIAESNTTPTCGSVGYEVFLRNMSALWRRDPRLAQRIDEVPEEEWPELIPTRSGASTSCPGGAWLHSRYDPRGEAERFVETIPVDDKYFFVLFGMGLGYHVEALLARMKGDSVLLAVEPSLATMATALACVDVSAGIQSGRLLLLDRLEKSDLHDKLQPYNTLMMIGTQFTAAPALVRGAEAFHDEARRVLTDYVAYSRMTLLTLVGNSQVTCRNIAHNLAHYAATPPVDALKDRFRGYPGIVISGGPSLRKNIELLAEAKGRAVLCSVQSLFKPLLARGMVPDFVTALDFHPMSRHFFDGAPSGHDVHLIAEPKVSWHVLDHYEGPVSLLHNSFVDQLIGGSLAARDGLKPGATVSHLAFYLAEYLGCDPIIFVGQDLAFTGHCFYIPGVDVHDTWRSEINRFNPMETREWERIARNRPILRKTKDVEGRPVYTDELLMTYLEQFERDFAVTRATIINATEGGAVLRGTTAMTLREAIDRYCTRPLPVDAFDYRKGRPWRDGSKLAATANEVRDRIAEIEKIDGICGEMLGLLEELETLTDDPPRFNQRLVRVDELRSIVTRSYRAFQIVNSATQMAELQRYAADRKIEAAGDDGVERAKRQLARDKGFVGGVRDGARGMLEILRQAVERLEP
ncbi:MAG: motility associated factor glycosyltransferase family protein [Phycisphaerales bacterium]|nr:motility associated factor glycosyltransferase family protein [Phycisphaerales bacterium]